MAESVTNSDLMEDIEGPPTSGSSVPAVIPENQAIHHESIPSLSTKGSDINLISRSSASAVCASEVKFFSAATRNFFDLDTQIEKDNFLENIRKGIQFPSLDLDQEYPYLLKEVDKIDEYSHPSESSDRYNLIEVKHIILQNTRRFRRLQTHKSYSPPKEIQYCAAIDDLVPLAFCHRRDAQHIYECEAELFLPAAPFTATADIATFIPMPQEWSMALTKLNRDNQHPFCALGVKKHALTFAVEAKSRSSSPNTSARQLAFYLCSAQHQRRALGYENHAIYGLSSVGHIATLFVSYWIKNAIAITPTHHEFDLSSFSQHLELFVVLCKLAEKSEEEFEEMKAHRNDPSILEKNKAAAANPWRELSKHSKVGKKAAGNARTMSGGVSDGMTSDSERDSDLLEEDFFRDSFETSKSFLTSENDNYHESQIPLKAEILQQYVPTDTTTLPPAKDIVTWAQHIADEIDGKDTIP